MCTSESTNDEYTTAKQPSRSTIIIYMYYKWRAIETEYYNTFLVMLPLARVFDVDVIILGHESIVSYDFCHFKRFQWFSSRRWCCSTLWLEDFDIEKSDDFTFFRCYSISISLHLEAINSLYALVLFCHFLIYHKTWWCRLWWVFPFKLHVAFDYVRLFVMGKTNSGHLFPRFLSLSTILSGLAVLVASAFVTSRFVEKSM